MKKFFTLFLVLLLVMAPALCVNAQCSVSTTVSSSSPQIGDTVKFTYKFSADKVIGSADLSFSFDNSKLKYVSSTLSANCVSSVIKVSYYDAQNTSKSLSVTFTFTATAVGNAYVNLDSSDIGDMDGNTLGVPTASKTITIKAKEKLPSNCNLSALKTPNGTLVPEFSPNVTSYTCTVDNSVTTFPMYETKADSKAKSECIGNVKLAVGVNTRSVRVTAQDGTTKVYTIKITRLPSGSTPAPTPAATPAAPITVNVSGKSMNLDKTITLALPSGFEKTDMDYNGTNVQCAVSGEICIVQLSADSDIQFYIYNKESSLFSPYLGISVAACDFIITSLPSQLPDGFSASQILIDGKSYPAATSGNLGSGYYLINVIDRATGESYWCTYCEQDKTVQRAPQSLLAAQETTVSGQVTPQPEKKKLINPIMLFLYCTAGALLLALIGVIIVVISKNSANRHKGNELPKRDWLGEGNNFNTAGEEYYNDEPYQPQSDSEGEVQNNFAPNPGAEPAETSQNQAEEAYDEFAPVERPLRKRFNSKKNKVDDDDFDLNERKKNKHDDDFEPDERRKNKHDDDFEPDERKKNKRDDDFEPDGRKKNKHDDDFEPDERRKSKRDDDFEPDERKKNKHDDVNSKFNEDIIYTDF